MKLIQLVVHLLPLETWENILSRISKLSICHKCRAGRSWKELEVTRSPKSTLGHGHRRCLRARAHSTNYALFSHKQMLVQTIPTRWSSSNSLRDNQFLIEECAFQITCSPSTFNVPEKLLCIQHTCEKCRTQHCVSHELGKRKEQRFVYKNTGG